MKKIKDVFYDLNDILVALIIVAAATLIILTNIDSILNYPTVLAEEMQTPAEDTPTIYAENPPIQNPDDGNSEQGNEGTTGAGIDDQNTSGAGIDDQNTAGGGVSGNPGTDTGEVVNYSVYIEPGSTGDKIADLLIGVGLFQSRQEFSSAVAAAGAEGKLRAGNFIIPSDATPAEVVSILTSQ